MVAISPYDAIEKMSVANLKNENCMRVDKESGVAEKGNIDGQNWLIDNMQDRPTDWLTDCLPASFIHSLTDWLTNWLTDWLTYLLIDWLTDWRTDWLTYLLIDWLTDWLTDLLTDRLADTPADGKLLR